jgi:hypothetical protein
LDKVQQRVLIAVIAGASVLVGAKAASGVRFYSDDPLWKLPPPLPVRDPLKRKIDYLYDFAINSVATPGQKQTPGAEIRSVNVNTLGEVPDSTWYTNRHYWHPMTIEQLRRGPDKGNQPVPPFRMVGAKTEGITPGFQMRDSRGRLYFCKPDPRTNPEMASAADVIGSKFFYAFGYNVPENYIAYFSDREIAIDPKASITPAGGRERKMAQSDLDKVLRAMTRDREGRFRVVASFQIPGKGVGPFRWEGTRDDDPNDIYLHEHRRELRGLFVFCAWLNHTDVKSGNTYDSLVELDGIPVIRHHLIDFGSMLGSDSDEPKNARFGHEFMIEKDKKSLLKIFAVGLYSPDWERAKFPHIRAVGHLEAATFKPDVWTPNYPVPAFLNRLPDDEFWAAKQVLSFTEAQIRALVETGEYTDPKAVEYITATLIQRRDRVGRVFFGKVLPLDRFEIRGGQLTFEDLGVKAGFNAAREYQIQWFNFDNATGAKTVLSGAASAQAPQGGEYTMAEIQTAGDNAKKVLVYVKANRVIGIDRLW